MIETIDETCYTCINCQVIKKICRLQNKKINHIYIDRCDKYKPRKMKKCELCGNYIISLAQHVSSYHNKTIQEYNILTRDKNTKYIHIRRKAIWEQ